MKKQNIILTNNRTEAFAALHLMLLCVKKKSAVGALYKGSCAGEALPELRRRASLFLLEYPVEIR